MSVVLIGRFLSDESDVRSSHPIRHHQFWCKRGSWEEPRGRYESLGFKHLYGYVNLNVFCFVFEISILLSSYFRFLAFLMVYLWSVTLSAVCEHSARPVFLLALAPLAFGNHLNRSIWETDPLKYRWKHRRNTIVIELTVFTCVY